MVHVAFVRFPSARRVAFDWFVTLLAFVAFVAFVTFVTFDTFVLFVTFASDSKPVCTAGQFKPQMH